MRMRPLLSGEHSLILEDGNVFEPRIFLEICDSRLVRPEHALDSFVAEPSESAVMLGGFDDDFMGADRPHLVVHPLGSTG